MGAPPILPTSMILILATIGFAVHLFLALQVWRSAEENGMSPLGWALFYFFTGPVGWIAFMIARGASGMGGSSVKPTYNPARARAIDSRSMDSASRSVHTFPRPSKDFSDGRLCDLITAGEWELAREHAREMKIMSGQDGNKALSEDYRLAMMWIDARRNPFAG